jgi:hypothetical protein
MRFRKMETDGLAGASPTGLFGISSGVLTTVSFI